jgi:type III pantothenate kinase
MTLALHLHEEVTSTNDVARAALLDGAPAGSLYRAERQTAGRGRHGNSWHSAPGNLLMSVVLRPRLVPERVPLVTLAAAVAVRAVLARHGVHAGLKWPNDLMVGGRKVGGILTEGVFEGGTLVGVVVGIGVNVALDVGSLEAPLCDTATSFAYLGRPLPQLDPLAREIARALLDQVEVLEEGKSDRVLASWKADNITLGESVELDQGGHRRRGRAIDLDAFGALVVDQDGGRRETVQSGEVRLLGQPRSDATREGLLLVIDVGNTNTVVGVYEGDRLKAHWRLQSHRDISADEHGLLMHQLLAVDRLSPSDIDHVILSCVVPPMISRLETMVRRFFARSPLVVGPGIRTGMPILYENPREVGADRVVNAVAAYERHRGGLIVVDFGTATTFDAVSPQGEYLGGAIAPGMAISADALFRNAARLPRVDFVRPERVVGRNTVASMQAGLLYGYVGLVKEIVERMKRELGFPTRVFATGGLSSLIGPEAEVIDEVDEHLTLEGLRLLFERNRDVVR